MPSECVHEEKKKKRKNFVRKWKRKIKGKKHKICTYFFFSKQAYYF